MEDITNIISISQISASADRGGWEMQFTVPNDTDLFEIGRQVFVTWNPALGTTPGALRNAFVGYVTSNRFSFGAGSSLATLTARTSESFLERGWVQGVNFADIGANVRQTYHQFDSVLASGNYRMTMGRIVQHLIGFYEYYGCQDFPSGLEWLSHTNMVYHGIKNTDGWIRLGDFTVDPWAVGFVDGSMRVDRYVVEETTNLWNTLLQIAKNEFFTVGFDKTDTMHYKRHPMFAATIPDVVLNINESMIIGQPSISYITPQHVSQVALHAVTDEGDTMHAYYPADTAIVYAKNRIDTSYIRCNDQTMLNNWALILYFYASREIDIQITLPGLCGLLLDTLQRVSITYTGTATNGVHLNWVDKKFWISDIVVTPDTSNGGTTELQLTAENSPYA